MEPVASQDIQAKELKGWSWGGLMLDPVLIIGARRHWMLLWYILMFVPFVNLLFILIFKIYLGFKGHEIVNASQGFSSDEERKGFMKGLNHAGFVFFIIAIAALVVGLCFFVIQILFLGSSIHTMQNMQVQHVNYPITY